MSARLPDFTKLLSRVPREDVFLVEVGSDAGRSVLLWFEAAKSLGKNLRCLCVDTWLGEYRKENLAQMQQFPFHFFIHSSYDDFRSNVEDLPVASIQTTSSIASHYVTELIVNEVIPRPDIIYIDASHLYADVVQDLRTWVTIPGGSAIICGDDYQLIDVREAISDTCARFDRRVELLSRRTWVML